MEIYGRRVITTDATEITSDNIVDELNNAFNEHGINRGEIEYLWNYFRGKQPILQRVKTVRPEMESQHSINSKSNENQNTDDISKGCSVLVIIILSTIEKSN